MESYKPKLGSILVNIPDEADTIEILVQVVNYSYFSAGITATPFIQETNSFNQRIQVKNGLDNFFAGSLIAMFIYQLILYLKYNRGRQYLWLGLICLGVALRAFIVHGGSFLLPNLLPGVAWGVWKKIEFGSVYSIVALFPLYVYHLFPEHAPKRPLLIFKIISSVLLIVLFFTPQYIYGYLLDVAHVGLLLSFIYGFYSIIKARISGNEEAKIILLGFLFSFPFILVEIIRNSILLHLGISLPYMVELGVLVFLLFQIYILANNFARAYQNLEQTVEERTSQLVATNRVKDRLLSVLSHDIKAPLNSLRGVLNIFNKGIISKAEFNELASQIEGDLNQTSILLENILHWTAAQLKGVQVQYEHYYPCALIQENIDLFKSITTVKGITISNNVPSDFTIESDRNIMNLTLRNLIANAIKFSHKGGSIDIFMRESEKFMTIDVRDNGVGMSEETLNRVLTTRSISKNGTSDEKGTGIGLNLCCEYLEKAGGQLIVKSQLGKGSNFSIQLPLRA